MIHDINKFTFTGVKSVNSYTSTSKSSADKSTSNNSIILPGSIFHKLNSSTNTTGIVFTLYKTATLFPLGKANKNRNNLTVTQVGSQVIAANLGHHVEGLEDLVVINLQLEIQVGVCY